MARNAWRWLTLLAGVLSCAPYAPAPDLSFVPPGCCPLDSTCPDGGSGCGLPFTCGGLGLDRANCGSCGNVCPPSSICADGVCSPCPDGWAVCSPSAVPPFCVDVTTDVTNCGICGSLCATDATCVAGRCVCPSWTVFCGAGQLPSCAQLSVDPSNCGSCGNVCPYIASGCVAGQCVCQTGAMPCGQGEAATCTDITSDASNCGACGNLCGQGQVCVAGGCVAMSLDAPVPIAPQSLSNVTTHTPTFRWTLPFGSMGGHIEVCTNAACDHVVQSMDEAGSSTRLPAVLAPGVYFWHVRAEEGGLYSSPWEFRVGALDSAVDSSYGIIPDVNQDGYADLVVWIGSSTSGLLDSSLWIYPGSASGPASTPLALNVPAAMRSVARVKLAGDAQGDGFPGLLLTFDTVGESLAQGASAGFEADQIFPVANSDMGSVTAVGDTDGNGYADLVIASEDGSVSMLLGYGAVVAGTGVIPLELGWVAAGGSPSVVGAGDVNGDGYADLVVSNGTNQDEFLGEAGGLVVGRPLFSTGGNTIPVAAGDLDGDGYSDVVVNGDCGGTGEPCVDLVYGSAMGLVRGGTLSSTVSSVVPIGDVNGDGRADLIAPSGTVGTATLFGGGTRDALENEAGTILTTPCSAGSDRFVALGDVNGDGYDDVADLCDTGGDSNADLSVLFGDATMPLMRRVQIALPASSGGGFGNSLALRGRAPGGLLTPARRNT